MVETTGRETARFANSKALIHISPVRMPERRSRAFHGSLTNDFGSFFVLTETQEDGVPQMPIPGPFSKTDLTDQFRFDPGAAAHFSSGQPLAGAASDFFRQVCKGTFGLPDFLKARVDCFEQSLIVTCADL